MLRSFIARTIDFSTRFRWPVVAVTLLVAVLSAAYAARYFAIDTDINHLISPDLAWRKNEQAFEKAFPKRAELILVVVQAPTPETVKQAAKAVAACLTVSGVGACTTTRISSARLGKARSNACSFLRHSRSGEMRWLMSVSMAKWRAA